MQRAGVLPLRCATKCRVVGAVRLDAERRRAEFDYGRAVEKTRRRENLLSWQKNAGMAQVFLQVRRIASLCHYLLYINYVIAH